MYLDICLAVPELYIPFNTDIRIFARQIRLDTATLDGNVNEP